VMVDSTVERRAGVVIVCCSWCLANVVCCFLWLTPSPAADLAAVDSATLVVVPAPGVVVEVAAVVVLLRRWLQLVVPVP
jgi:hypothetical protein